MTQSAPSDDRHLMLQAALDGELDAAGMLAFERAVQENAELAEEYRRLRALRMAFRGLPKQHASNDLRSRIETLTSVEKTQASRFGTWRPAALAAGLAFMLGSGLTALVLPQSASQSSQILVASHLRGLISGQSTDVLSSDQHTVKPWFASRVTVAPQVVDLAAAGFPLVGGRVDVVGDTALPTLVYRRRQHLISLTEGTRDRLKVPLGSQRLEGYSVLAWQQGEFDYVAVSDAAPSELETFSKAFREATKP